MSDSDRIKGEGAADKAKGAVKEGLGKVRGDEGQEAEGKTDKAKGTVKDKAADAMGKVDDAFRKVKSNQ